MTDRRADTVQRSVAATGTADHLAWEARQRKPAGVAAIAAAFLTLLGAVWGGLVFSDVPQGGMLEALDRAAEPGPYGTLESLRVPVYEFYDDNVAGVLASTVMRALGMLGLGWALTYLAVATRARRPEVPRIAQYLPAIGAVLSALATLLSTIATIMAVGEFLDGPRTVEDADVITESGLLVTAQLVNLPGLLALAARPGAHLPERHARGPAHALHGRAGDHHRRAAGVPARLPAADRAVLLAVHARDAVPGLLARRRPAGVGERRGECRGPRAGSAAAWGGRRRSPSRPRGDSGPSRAGSSRKKRKRRI